MAQQGTLILFCGKMAAGKSTAARGVAKEKNAVLISEDEWLSSLYPKQISSFDDYLKFSAQLKPLIKNHVQNILRTGVNVVMDFPANTKRQRQWLNDLATEITAQSELIYLQVNDSLCLQQLAQRRIEQPSRMAFDTEEVFYQVTKYFEAPEVSEGINLKVIEQIA